MKKIMLLVTVMLLMFTLVGCFNSGSTDVSELEARIEELEESLQQSQAALESAQNSLNTAQALIDDLYDQLFELTGVDQRLLAVVQKQKEAIMSMGAEEIIINSSFNYDGGSGIFGQILSAPRMNLLSQTSPFEQDEEWQDIQIRYYEMLEQIVQQGYEVGEVVSINEFTFTQPLDYYFIDFTLNEEYFIKINLDGNETLFSRILTYDNLELTEAKTVKARNVTAKFVNSKLELVLVIQEFDENEIMSALYIEHFKEDIGCVWVSFSEEMLFEVAYYVGINVRDDLGAILNIFYGYNSVVTSEQYDLYYTQNEEVDVANVYIESTYLIGKHNLIQSYLTDNKTDASIINLITSYYSYINENKNTGSIYSIGSGYHLELDLEKMDPLMDLYNKILTVNNYLAYTEPLSSNKQAKFNSLVQELDSYTYDSVVYDFINYDEETDTYSLVDAMEQLPLSIINYDGYFQIYNPYVAYKNLLNTENKTFEQYLELLHHVSKMEILYNLGNNIFKSTYGDTIVLNETVSIEYGTDNEIYIEDVNYLMNNKQIILNLFPSYYNSTPDTISSLLEDGILYDPSLE